MAAIEFLPMSPDPATKLPPRGAFRLLRLSSEEAVAYDPDSGKFAADARGHLIGIFLDEPSARASFGQVSKQTELGELVLVGVDGRVLDHNVR